VSSRHLHPRLKIHNLNLSVLAKDIWPEAIQ
jgi:hypothetical protein